ncbi:AP2-like ethylene-responsive transcription factor AIL5 [Typha angustifolia]|uniref:AP2-like ethylene-responsive transcription factor AIL5 n=1 Tax=Typha angustifolia TaxID=59011 RepID=UPI003C2EDEA0
MDMDTSSHHLLAFSLAHHRIGEEEMGAAEELAAMAGVGPKLEDFLGGCGGEVAMPASAPVSMYDSDFKDMAAGFQDSVATKDLAPDSRKAVDSFGQRTSIYRGVTRHRWTGRYEAHLWDNSCRREGQSRKGRQVYLGGYDKEEKAARAYDLAALKYWGPTTTTNFPIANYEKELEEMTNMTRQEFVASLRRKSSGFSRGASIYRGVTRHHQHGRWQARIGRVAGNKDLYLGTFSTQEEAAEAYDIAAIKFRGMNAVTNFDMSRYDVKSIVNSSLPIGGMSCRTSRASESSSPSSSDTLSLQAKHATDSREASAAALGFAVPQSKHDQDYWSLVAQYHHQQQQQQQQNNQALGFGLLPTHEVVMDYCNTSSDGAMAQCTGVWSNGIFLDQQQEQAPSSSNSSSIPYVTPISLVGSHDQGPSYVGSWVTPPSTYYHQAAKPNVAVFQTPVFGME